ncbi:Fasciclin domain-containing protein [Arachidicoccus rhizosphaerae]|uniref:Fasciclin domain-containing protein n=1 Tax=Arachidicoccus rhizosphaerae TaxID=551991 RepID=A0A1H3XGX4_9BACT|nr:fasciclin domain-containing protein [Arachidicoccus rhizosphaerae]SDZ98593.1 Fasciclin domain-containing protein [Arachidicoccus rhizosphaerae]
MKNYKIAILLITASLSILGCQKKYITGGKIEDINKYSSLSTYDALSSMSQFDTLVQVIDAAGLKDEINKAQSTFFAPSDASVYNYLNERTIDIQATVDQYAKFTLDSLKYHLEKNIDGIADSLKMYIIPSVLNVDAKLSSTGSFYKTGLSGDSAIVSYEYTYDENMGYSDLVSTPPRLVYYTHLWKPYQLDDQDSTAADIPAKTGVHTLVTTSFMNTQNGVVHVLSPGSTLFFYGTKVED